MNLIKNLPEMSEEDWEKLKKHNDESWKIRDALFRSELLKQKENNKKGNYK